MCLKPLGHLSSGRAPLLRSASFGGLVGGSYSAPCGAGNGIFPDFPTRHRLASVRPVLGGAMVLFRALGWLLLAMTVAAAVQNGLTWW